MVADPHVAHAVGSSRDTVVCPSSQYHAGIRWPHQSWRLMHQSWMFAEPREVRVRPLLGHDARDSPSLDRGHRRLGERLHLHEPLRRDHRLDDGARSLRARERHRVRLRLRARARAPASRAFTALRASKRSMPANGAAVVVHLSVEREHREERQAVALADLEVVEVVRGRDLHRAGAERHVDEDRVADDRDLAAEDRMAHRLADEVRVARDRPGARRSPCRRASSPAASSRRRSPSGHQPAR